MDQSKEMHFQTDSAGTASYHLGELPDERMRDTALVHGIDLTHRARQFCKTDFSKFDYIIAMDASNKRDVTQLEEKIKGNCKIFMMRDFDVHGKSLDVPDPYFGGIKGFQEVYQILHRSNQALLEYLMDEHGMRNEG